MSIIATSEVDGVHTSICDVCMTATITGTHDDESDKALLEAAGWRWRPGPGDPLDTCPDCLKAGA